MVLVLLNETLEVNLAAIQNIKTIVFWKEIKTSIAYY